MSFLPLVTGMLLVGCGQHGGSDSGGNAADPAGGDSKSIVVHVSGDRSAGIRADGASGTIALMPTRAGKTLVTITAARSEENANRTVEVVVGPFAAPSLAGLARGGPALDAKTASVKFVEGERETAFTNAFYEQFHDASAYAADSRVLVTFTTVTKLDAANGIARYHLVGSFRFNAAHSPEPLPPACGTGATHYAALHGERHPHFDGKFCGSRKIVVEGRFESVEQVPEG